MPTCENSHTCREDYKCKSFPNKEDCPFKAPGYPAPYQQAENKAGIPVKNASYWRRDSEARGAELVEAVELLKKCQPLVADNYAVCEDSECDECGHTDCVDKLIKSFLSKRQGGS